MPPEPTRADAETVAPDLRQSQVMSWLVLNYRLSHGVRWTDGTNMWETDPSVKYPLPQGEGESWS